MPDDRANVDPAEIRNLTLMETIRGRDSEAGTAYAEIYPPLNFAKAVQHRQPELLERFRCLALRRAVVQNAWKLIQVEERPDELFDLGQDPLELVDRLADHSSEAGLLNQRLNLRIRQAETVRDNLAAGGTLDIEKDEQLLKRLRVVCT